MNNLSWTMNCILFGAEIIQIVKDNKPEEVITKIKNLSSEFDDTTAKYLLMRLSGFKVIR